MQDDPPGELVLVRHGETAWSREHRHTGRTDVPLTPHGEAQARALAPELARRRLAAALSSPLQRARRTAALAGLQAEVDPDLVEWDHGDYEGRTTRDVRTERPGWWLWTDGAPGGEQPHEVAVRCARTLDRVAPLLAHGDVALVGHGHALRVLAAAWLGLPAAQGGLFTLDAASVSALAVYRGHPVVSRWNDVAAHARGRAAPGAA